MSESHAAETRPANTIVTTRLSTLRGRECYARPVEDAAGLGHEGVLVGGGLCLPVLGVGRLLVSEHDVGLVTRHQPGQAPLRPEPVPHREDVLALLLLLLLDPGEDGPLQLPGGHGAHQVGVPEGAARARGAAQRAEGRHPQTLPPVGGGGLVRPGARHGVQAGAPPLYLLILLAGSFLRFLGQLLKTLHPLFRLFLGFVLQRLGQLGVGGLLLRRDGVQVLEDVLPVVDGGQILGAVQVNVQLPEVDPEVDEEGDAVEVPLGRGEVQRRVAVVVMLLRVTPGNYTANEIL